tara:strand:+ start:24741 stop:25106 length:366 start_codon:yes stop_codon:yes gene_type:complete
MKINWFEIPVSDMERAIAFYQTVFAIEIKKQEFGEVVMGQFPPNSQEGAATGALMMYPSYIPSEEGALLYFDSADIHTELNRVVDAGGKIQREKTLIAPEHGYMAVFTDSEGNRIALHSTD